LNDIVNMKRSKDRNLMTDMRKQAIAVPWLIVEDAEATRDFVQRTLKDTEASRFHKCPTDGRQKTFDERKRRRSTEVCERISEATKMAHWQAHR
jgi:hypothetical protein